MSLIGPPFRKELFTAQFSRRGESCVFSEAEHTNACESERVPKRRAAFDKSHESIRNAEVMLFPRCVRNTSSRSADLPFSCPSAERLCGIQRGSVLGVGSRYERFALSRRTSAPPTLAASRARRKSNGKPHQRNRRQSEVGALIFKREDSVKTRRLERSRCRGGRRATR